MYKICSKCGKNPIAPPSKVICKDCQDKITKTLEYEIARLEGKV